MAKGRSRVQQGPGTVKKQGKSKKAEKETEK